MCGVGRQPSKLCSLFWSPNGAFWGQNGHFGLQIQKNDHFKKIKVVSDPVFNKDSGNTHPDFIRPAVFALELRNDRFGQDGASQNESPASDHLFPR